MRGERKKRRGFGEHRQELKSTGRAFLARCATWQAHAGVVRYGNCSCRDVTNNETHRSSVRFSCCSHGCVHHIVVLLHHTSGVRFKQHKNSLLQTHKTLRALLSAHRHAHQSNDCPYHPRNSRKACDSNTASMPTSRSQVRLSHETFECDPL